MSRRRVVEKKKTEFDRLYRHEVYIICRKCVKYIRGIHLPRRVHVYCNLYVHDKRDVLMNFWEVGRFKFNSSERTRQRTHLFAGRRSDFRAIVNNSIRTNATRSYSPTRSEQCIYYKSMTQCKRLLRKQYDVFRSRSVKNDIYLSRLLYNIVRARS